MKRLSKTLILAATVLTAIPAMAAEPLRVGIPTSRTGALAVLGDQVVQAIEFAAEEINAKGGVEGRKVEIRVADDEGNPDAGRRVAEKLSIDGYKIFIGTISSSVGLALSTQLNRWDAMYISVVNKSPRITGDSCKPRMFRANHSDDMDFAIVAPWLKEQKGENWAIIGADYLWGRGSGEAFRKNALALGRKIKVELYPPLGTGDFAPFITQLRDSGVDGIWVALPGSDAINFAKQAKQFGLTDKVVMFGHNFVTPSTVKAVGKDAIGIWGNLGYAPDIKTPQNEAFVAAWRAKFKADPTDYNGEAYAGMQMLFAAVKKAGSVEPKAVSQALEGLTVSTVFGDATMRAADHQLVLPNYIGRVSEVNGEVAIRTVSAFDAAIATPPASPDCKL